MRMVLFLCILVPQLVAAQVHPPLDPFSEALLAAFHTGDARQFEQLLSTTADHALVVKAVEDAAPTDWMDSLQAKPHPGKVKFRAACLELRAFGEQRGIVWDNMSALHPEKLTTVMREASDGSERLLQATEFRFPFESDGRWFAIRVDFLLNTGKDWKIGNDALWLEAYIEAVDGPGFWARMAL